MKNNIYENNFKMSFCKNDKYIERIVQYIINLEKNMIIFKIIDEDINIEHFDIENSLLLKIYKNLYNDDNGSMNKDIKEFIENDLKNKWEEKYPSDYSIISINDNKENYGIFGIYKVSVTIVAQNELNKKHTFCLDKGSFLFDISNCKILKSNKLRKKYKNYRDYKNTIQITWNTQYSIAKGYISYISITDADVGCPVYIEDNDKLNSYINYLIKNHLNKFNPLEFIQMYDKEKFIQLMNRYDEYKLKQMKNSIEYEDVYYPYPGYKYLYGYDFFGNKAIDFERNIECLKNNKFKYISITAQFIKDMKYLRIKFLDTSIIENDITIYSFLISFKDFKKYFKIIYVCKDDFCDEYIKFILNNDNLKNAENFLFEHLNRCVKLVNLRLSNHTVSLFDNREKEILVEDKLEYIKKMTTSFKMTKTTLDIKFKYKTDDNETGEASKKFRQKDLIDKAYEFLKYNNTFKIIKP